MKDVSGGALSPAGVGDWATAPQALLVGTLVIIVRRVLLFFLGRRLRGFEIVRRRGRRGGLFVELGHSRHSTNGVTVGHPGWGGVGRARHRMP